MTTTLTILAAGVALINLSRIAHHAGRIAWALGHIGLILDQRDQRDLADREHVDRLIRGEGAER